MPDVRELSPTRSAYLELKDEQALVREGYEFLDEKRMILAAEMLRQLDAYKAQAAEYEVARAEAARRLAGTLMRHGFDGLSVYPPTPLASWTQAHGHNRFLGLDLLEPAAAESEHGRPASAAFASAEAEACREAYTHLTDLGGRLAARIASLRRLVAEYTRTERRARALENVLLPEIESGIQFMEEQLEAVDQEEALRARHAGKQDTSRSVQPVGRPFKS